MQNNKRNRGKTVTNAWIKCLVMVIIFFLPLILCNAQSSSVVHLSYNTKEPVRSIKKIENPNGNIEFYIDNECFQYQKDKGEISKIEAWSLDDIDIITIEALLSLSEQKKRELLRKEEKTGTVQILTKDRTFDKIYLYERSQLGIIQRYEVRWIERIE